MRHCFPSIITPPSLLFTSECDAPLRRASKHAAEAGDAAALLKMNCRLRCVSHLISGSNVPFLSLWGTAVMNPAELLASSIISGFTFSLNLPITSEASLNDWKKQKQNILTSFDEMCWCICLTSGTCVTNCFVCFFLYFVGNKSLEYKLSLTMLFDYWLVDSNRRNIFPCFN